MLVTICGYLNKIMWVHIHLYTSKKYIKIFVQNDFIEKWWNIPKCLFVTCFWERVNLPWNESTTMASSLVPMVVLPHDQDLPFWHEQPWIDNWKLSSSMFLLLFQFIALLWCRICEQAFRGNHWTVECFEAAYW